MRRRSILSFGKVSSTPWIICRLLVCCLLVLPLSSALGAPFEAEFPPDSHPLTWIGPDGHPLPFQSHDEILEFLRTATIVTMEDIPVGVTKPKKVLLEKDGIQMHAVFRDVDVFKRRSRMKGKVQFNFRDSCIYECASYRLARLLGLDSIPPVVKRKIDDKEGTIQAWVEKAMTEKMRKDKDLSPPDPVKWMRQHQIMWFFDNLICNEDRNMGNILIDGQWKMWLIDATRAFRTSNDLRNPSLIRFCDRNVWDRLRGLTEETLKANLSEYLSESELRGLIRRKAKLEEHVQKMIAERGESEVLFVL